MTSLAAELKWLKMRPPRIEEFMEDARMLAAIQQDEKKHKATFRQKIEYIEINKVGGDWHKLQFRLSDDYSNKIAAVKTQEEYDALFLDIYDVACLSSVIADDMRHSCAILDYHLDQIKYADYVCPCCGREVTLEDTDKLLIDYDDRKFLEDFYNEFYKNRHKDLERLRKLGAQKHFDLCNWQKDLKQAAGSSARVEDIEGETSEVSQVMAERQANAEKERKRSAVEMAREWIGRKRAEGFKFAGEE